MINVAIIGCGNMGIAYARSFVKYEIVTKQTLLLVEKNNAQAQELQKMNIGEVVGQIDETIKSYEIIILAVKPQDFSSISEQLSAYLEKKQLVLSIMAGITIEKLTSMLNHPSIIRAMPNTPAQVSMGVTAYVASEGTTLEQIRKVEKLLSTTGREIFLEDEGLLDAVTAVSGSGPAYFYYFVRAMIAAGKQLGMDEAMASLLVKQTMIGSYHLMNNSDKSLDELIASVKSKGGTTEAALNTFEQNDLHNSIIKALKNAEARAKELSK